MSPVPVPLSLKISILLYRLVILPPINCPFLKHSGPRNHRASRQNLSNLILYLDFLECTMAKSSRFIEVEKIQMSHSRGWKARQQQGRDAHQRGPPPLPQANARPPPPMMSGVSGNGRPRHRDKNRRQQRLQAVRDLGKVSRQTEGSKTTDCQDTVLILGKRMRDSLCMEKHHLKKWSTPPKKWSTPPERSDPANNEYITVPKKVALDSLVEFPPQELNSCQFTCPVLIYPY